MSGLFDDIWDWVSGGQITRNNIERSKLSTLRSKLETTVKNYNYWYSQSMILSKALYQVTIQAFTEICKLNDIKENLTVEQRNIIEHDFRNKKFKLKDIESAITALKSVSNSSGILLNTDKFFQGTLDDSLSILKDMPNNTGLATAGIYTLISGLDHYASLNNQFQELKSGQYEALKRIDKLEGRLLELKVKIHRADEMGAGLGKGISTFHHCYNDVYEKLFPKGEESKRQREARKAAGGKYFLDSEKQEIKFILEAAKYILKMVEAKP